MWSRQVGEPILDAGRNQLAGVEAGRLGDRHQAALCARFTERRAVCAQDEAFELLVVALPLGDRCRAHFALDSAPETPGSLRVPALHGENR